jgi:pyruvate dehydrogenase E2 component (dihydrolipoamide acetyltransferase)
MPIFTLPELGENLTAGLVTKVLVSVGDSVTVDQPVVELETDKATIEVPVSVAGTITEIRVKSGDTVSVGDAVLVLGAGVEAETGAADVADAPAEEIVVGSSEPEPEPAEAAPASHSAEPSTDADDPTVEGAPASSEHESAQVSPPPRSTAPSIARQAGSVASPAVRRLARELGVDSDEVVGTGPAGRVSQEDVKAHTRSIVERQVAPTTRARVPSLPDFSRWGEVERRPMSSVRRATAAHLSHAWTAVPHVTQFDKADITVLDGLRKRYAAEVEEVGGKLTITVILVKVLGMALRRFPQVNVSVDMATSELIQKSYGSVGVAVDTDRGLLVPVVRDVDTKTLSQLAVEIQTLAGKARERKLTLDEMGGGSISVTNLGGIGGTYFTPIVNWPEVAILGVSRGVMEPVFEDGAFQPRLLLPLSLSYDHRAIDGADAIRFLRFVVRMLEQPFLMALQD